MIPPSDELRELWQSDIRGGGANDRELLRQLEQRARDFDRVIRRRDFREIAAGVLVAAIFLWLAVRAETMLDRFADVWLAACGLWIIVFLRRYSQLARKPALEQTLAAYSQSLLERYDRQIHLLKNAKYWYILPFWTGLLLSAVAFWLRGGDRLPFVVLVIFVTAVNVAVWWLNEIAGVRHLLRRREEVAALIR